MQTRLLATWTVLGMFGCDAEPMSFAADARPCGERDEVCPELTPTLLDLADLDGDGSDELISVGLVGQLAVASWTGDEYVYRTTHVPVGAGSQLSTCSSGDGAGGRVLYRQGEQWWLWGLSDGQLELVDGGHPSLTATVACLDLGLDADVIVVVDGGTLTLPSMTFQLQPVDTSIDSVAAMPTTDGAVFSLFASVAFDSDLRVATLELGTESILGETTWSLNLTRIDALAVAGRDLVVAGRSDGAAELVLVRNLEPTAPMPSEIERVSLPWEVSSLTIDELDGDPEAEVVIAPFPVSTVAVFGMAGTGTELVISDLEFEGIDLATGDHDGDGRAEVYVLDPREERIIEVPI